MDKPIIVCHCGHTNRVHAKTDGKCLGGTRLQPMGCVCKEFGSLRGKYENEKMEKSA
jgi:hypothetical protein